MLLVPEVLEAEVAKNLGEKLLEAALRFEDAVSVLTVFGINVYDESPFDARELSRFVSRRLDILGTRLIRHPLTIENTRAALARVNAELPPNGPKNQQFKDSLLWEALIDLSHHYDVVFVTADKGFFADRNPRKGLASSLVSDLDDRGGNARVVYYDEIESVLTELQQGLPSINERHIIQAATAAVRQRIEETARLLRISFGERVSATASAFLTDLPDRLIISFRLVFAVTDRRRGYVGHSGTYSLDGVCSYLYSTDEITDVEVTSGGIRWKVKPKGRPDWEGMTSLFAEGQSREYGPELPWEFGEDA